MCGASQGKKKKRKEKIPLRGRFDGLQYALTFGSNCVDTHFVPTATPTRPANPAVSGHVRAWHQYPCLGFFLAEINKCEKRCSALKINILPLCAA